MMIPAVIHPALRFKYYFFCHIMDILKTFYQCCGSVVSSFGSRRPVNYGSDRPDPDPTWSFLWPLAKIFCQTFSKSYSNIKSILNLCQIVKTRSWIRNRIRIRNKRFTDQDKRDQAPSDPQHSFFVSFLFFFVFFFHSNKLDTKPRWRL
jgi:hypothetical protein